MKLKRSVNNILTEQELKKVKVEACVQSLFPRLDWVKDIGREEE